MNRATLFVLSFRHRDELIDNVERAGWHVIAARRAEAVERRFLASGAMVAIIDARGAFDEGLAAAHLLGEVVEANASALLVLLSHNDLARVDTFFEAGATHFLASPFGEYELAQAIRFTARYVARLGGGDPFVEARGLSFGDDDLWWRWRPGDLRVMRSPALARRFPGSDLASDFLRTLDSEGRDAALRALRRLTTSGRATGFAHMAPDMDARRIAQHLSRDPVDGTIVGRIEELGELPPNHRRGHRDRLTGLADRQGALRWLTHALEQHDGGATNCILLLISISRFEAINAAFGRETGDALLQAAARRIERLVSGFASRRHMVARLAGAEFAIILLGSAQNGEARLLADQLLEVASRPFISGDTIVNFACRIGGTVAEPGEADPAALLRRASASLAEAKVSEGGSAHLLTSHGLAASEVESRLEIDLRSALEKDEIEVLFQPQLSITTGAIIGVEALARWQHPVFGELGAAPLFAAAERSDYLVPLSRHVQRKALTIAARNKATFRWLRLAINVTAADIAQPQFATQLLQLIDECKFDRKRVTVEVTESGLIEDLGQAATLLATLRSGGLQIAIDDFGTGYSSLAYLKALPLDYLKIDHQLSQDITGSARGRTVVTSVIELARSLGLSVVAEGIENEQQLSLLAEAGCNAYQGFIFSPPISVAELGRLMRRQG